jgi:hypothetical protein
MPALTAAASGSFTIGADLTVNRLVFGSMRLTGKGVWGEPGTSTVAHLEDNIAAATVELSDEDFEALAAAV